jgi:hypothetical protein
MSEPKNFTGYFRKGQAIIAFYCGLPDERAVTADKQSI